MKKLVLIADDDVRNRKLISDVLQAAGYDTLTATDGEHAIAMARSSNPALILMDVQMPFMDGFSAVKVLKADPATRPIPVVAITALVMDGDHDDIREAGFDGYLGKPMGIKELRSIVAVHIDP